MSTQLPGRFAFLGSGIIAELWISRLISTGSLTPERIMVCDICPGRQQELRERFRVLAGGSNREGAEFADTIVLAPPPGETLKVLREVSVALDPRKAVISLAAGLALGRLEAEAKPSQAIRIMPNTPGQVGEAMNLVAYGRTVHEERRGQIENLLKRLGCWLEVEDEQMDLWCALCAVGPTYVFPVIEALASSAAAKGLPPGAALEAAAQVVAGAARMVQHSGKTIPQLKEMISIRTLREPEAAKLFGDAYEEAVAKLLGLGQRLSAAA